MSNEDIESYKEELEKLIGLLDRVHTPQARQIIAARFQQLMAQMIAQIDQEVAC